MTGQEKAALDGLDASATQLPNGQFQVKVMWKPNEPNLINNLPLALKRQANLEKGKHLKDEKDREDYNKVFRGWIEKQYLIPVPVEEI